MISPVQSGTLSGIEARGVQVEVSPIRGLPGFDVVGLPEAAVRESRVRVQAALMNAGYALPEQRFVVNLAPADLRKTGSAFDLAIAIALLAQCGMCAPNKLAETLIIGELSLDGHLRPVRGLLPQLRGAQARGLAAAIVPDGDSAWSELVAGMEVRCAAHLREVVAFLGAEGQLALPPRLGAPTDDDGADLCDVRGQHGAKRALEIAAAGNHNLLMIGPPGTGKTMLARRLPGILPLPERHEALEIATIASAAGFISPSARRQRRPFRAPHHSCSDAALVGGGDPIRPGEVTLAHRGVLFLDELPEFRRNALESLRPVMEAGLAEVVRVRDRAVMPANPLIVAAMNPCPCGYHGHKKRICRCGPDRIDSYRARISGPLLDRFDLHVALPAIDVEQLECREPLEDSVQVRARVIAARDYAGLRVASERKKHGADRRTPQQRLADALEPEARSLLHRAMQKLQLSLRAYDKVLRVSRTLADLEQSEIVRPDHVAEAVQYRLLDRPEPPARARVPAVATSR
ncbi:MAG: YifB family Mg chelatase-like AAA ATPase [Myxococcales bacterium]|nr:YifB family Mg chelatase-like AAA ATPase [Myxococcales bacterium]